MKIADNWLMTGGFSCHASSMNTWVFNDPIFAFPHQARKNFAPAVRQHPVSIVLPSHSAGHR